MCYGAKAIRRDQRARCCYVTMRRRPSSRMEAQDASVCWKRVLYGAAYVLRWSFGESQAQIYRSKTTVRFQRSWSTYTIYNAKCMSSRKCGTYKEYSSLSTFPIALFAASGISSFFLWVNSAEVTGKLVGIILTLLLRRNFWAKVEFKIAQYICIISSDNAKRTCKCANLKAAAACVRW